LTITTARNPKDKCCWKASVFKTDPKPKCLLSAEGTTCEMALAELHNSSAEAGWDSEMADMDCESMSDNESVSTVSEAEEETLEDKRKDGGEGSDASRPRSRSRSRSSSVVSGLDIVREHRLQQPAPDSMPCHVQGSNRPIVPAPLTAPAIPRMTISNAPNLAPNSVPVVIRIWLGQDYCQTMVQALPTRKSLYVAVVNYARNNSRAFTGAKQSDRDALAMPGPHLLLKLHSVTASGQETYLGDYSGENLDMWFRKGAASLFAIRIRPKTQPSQALPRAGQSTGRPAAGKPVVVQEHRAEDWERLPRGSGGCITPRDPGVDFSMLICFLSDCLYGLRNVFACDWLFRYPSACCSLSLIVFFCP
jgi:hypothetical protein